MILNSRSRGLVAAYNNSNAAALLAEMQQAFAGFRDRQERDVNDIRNAVDDLNGRFAAMRIGGGAGSDLADQSARAALTNLGEFGRSGNPDALRRGFQVSASMSSDSDPDGGYLAPDELSTELMRIQRNDSVMRRIAHVIQTNSAAFKQPISIGGTGSGWVGERESRPETVGTSISMIAVHSGEIYANPAITQNLLDDSAYDLGAYIAQEIGDEFNEREGDAFINGDGINKPRGFLTYDTATTADATRSFGVIQHKTTGVAAALSDATHNGGDALIDLVYSLKAKYRQNAVFVMNSTTAGIVRKFKTIGDTEHYIWAESIAPEQPARLLGYPVEIDESMPDVGAGAFPIAFGDFNRGYIIADRTDVRILRDPYTNKPYVHFYTTKRVGGAVMDSNAIKLLKVSA